MGVQLLCLGLGFTLWWFLGSLTRPVPDRLRLFARSLRGGLLGAVLAWLLAMLVTHISPGRMGAHFFPALAAGLVMIGVSIGALAPLAVWKRYQEPTEQAEVFAERLRKASGESESTSR